MKYLSRACRVSAAVLTLLVFTHSSITYSCEKEACLISDRIVNDPVQSCICNALLHLFNDNPAETLHQLDQAAVYKKQMRPSENESDFLITLCKVIAYDKLGLQNDSIQYENQLFGYLNSASEDPLQDNSITYAESVETLEFLHDLIALSPSLDVRARLSSFVNDPMDPKWQSDSKEGLQYRSGGTSKFIKRWKHILKNTKEIYEIVKGFISLALEINEEINH